MKTIVFILLFMLTICSKADGQLPQPPIIDGDVYIYEFAMKRMRRANLGFIIVKGNSFQNISFDIYITKDTINKINRTVSPPYSDNDVAEKLGDFYYNSDDFVNKRRLIPDNIYKMISPFFLKITNEERLKILNELTMILPSSSCASQKYSVPQNLDR